MKAKLITVAIAGALLAAGAWAQMGPGTGGGFGPGGGCGYGPGMMRGAGPGAGMGPGYGRGPGMVGGYGPGGGRGGWMMGAAGPGAYAGLNLTEEQRGKVDAIQAEFRNRQQELRDKMHVQRSALFGADGVKPDDAAVRKIYEGISETRKAMFENGLEMRKRVDEVLTKEQREQQQQFRGGRRFG